MLCIVVHILASFRVIFRALEGIQIELHGQYSLARLDELIVVARQMSLLRALAVPLYTPLSCLATIVILDVLPLRPPTGGIRNQSATYWVRAFASIAIVTVTTFIHFQHASPRLPTMVTRSVIAATVVSVVATVIYGVLHLLIGFPTPFMFEAIGPPWQMLQFCAMWTVWKTCIRENVEVKRDLLQYVWLFTCQYAMLLTYPVMIYVFRTLDGLQQTVFSFGLPIYKLFLKHWASSGVYRVEDLAPLYVVLSVDVFHALMLSCAMQSAVSRGTLLSVMAVDVCQSVVAIVEVATIIERIRPLHLEILSSDSTVAPLSWHTLDPGDVVTMASSILACHPQIRETPVVALPRHERHAVHPQFAWATTRRAVSVSKPRITPTSGPSTPRVPNTRGSRDRVRSITKLSPEVEYVRLSLKLLHMVEFYVLIEFTEVILAVIYAIYLTAMFHMPNRLYYSSVKSLTREQLFETVGRVLQYAALELLSLVVLVLVLDRLIGFSTLRLLAFSLQKHALLAQSLLVLWVFFATQSTLEHLGNDYTFRFEWLRHPNADN